LKVNYGDKSNFYGLYARNENDSNKWNRAVFNLKPTGEFNIEFFGGKSWQMK